MATMLEAQDPRCVFPLAVPNEPALTHNAENARRMREALAKVRAELGANMTW